VFLKFLIPKSFQKFLYGKVKKAQKLKNLPQNKPQSLKSRYLQIQIENRPVAAHLSVLENPPQKDAGQTAQRKLATQHEEN
jgi:hypothetical protein